MKKTLRILIIEDSEGDTLFLVRRLERSGFTPTWKRVDTIESLRTALAEETWDIAFSDYSMPGLRIRDVLALVKEREEKAIKIEWQFSIEAARGKMNRHYQQVNAENAQYQKT